MTSRRLPDLPPPHPTTHPCQLIPVTPTLTGHDAEAVLREILEGTPDTPTRRRRIELADSIYESQVKVATKAIITGLTESP